MKARWWKWVVGCVGVGVVALGVWRLMRTPASMNLSAVHAEQIAFFERLMPEGEAATTILEGGWRRMEGISAAWPGEQKGHWPGVIRALPYAVLTPDERETARALFESLRLTVDEVMRGASAPRVTDDFVLSNGVLWTMRDPDAWFSEDHLRMAAATLRAELRIATIDGDIDRAIECLDASLDLANLYRQAPDILGVMRARSSIDMLIDAILRISHDSDLPAEFCERAATHLLDRRDWSWMQGPDHVEAVAFHYLSEEAEWRDGLAQAHSLDLLDMRLRRFFGGELSSDDEDAVAWLDWTCARSPARARRQIKAYAAAYGVWIAQPFDQRAAPAPSIDGYPYASSQAKVAEDVHAWADLLPSLMTGATLALRLTAMEQRGELLPTTLESLDWPERIDPLTGRLFDYTLQTPTESDPRPFVIRIPVSTAELARVAPNLARHPDHVLLVTPEPIAPEPQDLPRRQYEWLSPVEADE